MCAGLWGLSPNRLASIHQVSFVNILLNLYFRSTKFNRLGCYWELSNIRLLTHWGQYKIQAVLQTTFSNTLSWMKIYEFWLIFSLKSVPKGPVNNISVLVQIMAWRRSGDKPLFEPMMVNYWSIYAPLGLNEYFFFIGSNFCKMSLVWSERTWHFRLQLRKLLW